MDNCPNTKAVEVVVMLKKVLKTSPVTAYLAMMVPGSLRKLKRPRFLFRTEPSLLA
jgi:hypothetical protein